MIKLRHMFFLPLFFIAIFIRLYNFDNRVLFGMEQGVTLGVVADYLENGPKLIGGPNVQRYTSTGKQLFVGSLYFYHLMPVMKMLGPDPVPMTYWSLFLNLLTGVLIYYLFSRRFSILVGWFSAFFYFLSLTMIQQSLTVWLLNPLPLVGLLMLYLLLSRHTFTSLGRIFFLGLLSGIAFNLEYLNLFPVIFLFLYLCYRLRRPTLLLIFLGGIILANIPLLAFELRHDWYHLRTLYQYFLDTLTTPAEAKFASYHLFLFWPFFSLLTGLFSAYLWQFSRFLTFGVLLLYIFLNLHSPVFSLANRDLTVTEQKTIASKITSLVSTDRYNVVFLPESEYRAHALRYLLTYLYHNPPAAVENYNSLDSLFVVSDSGTTRFGEIWETSARTWNIITPIYDIQPGLTLYQLK